MSRLVETIKIENGSFKNLPYHQARFEKSQMQVFGVKQVVQIKSVLDAYWAQFMQTHQKVAPIMKCRFEYDTEIHNISVEAYHRKRIHSLQIVHCDDIDYTHKSTNRQKLNELSRQAKSCDEILICKNGFITDTSFTNVALFDGAKWITPTDCLLKGTKRQYLLDNNILTEEKMHFNDILSFKKIRLINAMIDFEDAVDIPIEKIYGITNTK